MNRTDALVSFCRTKLPRLLISLIAPLLILLLRPLGMNLSQAATVASLVMVVTWWSTGWVNKILASCVLLACFVLFSGAAPKQVFTFLLSENFPMIALTYLFSEGITQSGLIEKVLLPRLGKFATSPMKILLSMIAVLALTIYLVPQSLARLIIVAMIFDNYMRGTDLDASARRVLMCGCFVFYALVNMVCVNADIILNTSTLAFSGLQMGDLEWAKNMALPTVVYGALMVLLFSLVFRREIKAAGRVRLTREPEKTAFTKRDWTASAIIALTILLWASKGLHHINATLITLLATAAMFATGMLKPRDFRAIDVTTLVFLTAAFSIGGVMKSCGAAELIFSRLKTIFPAQFSLLYILTLALIGKALHLVLGSNTTTLSLLIPGLMLICTDVMSPTAIMYVAYLSVVVQSLLPFHSVALMIGTAHDYFDTKTVFRFGLPMLFLVFFALSCVYLPWWKIIGLL